MEHSPTTGESAADFTPLRLVLQPTGAVLEVSQTEVIVGRHSTPMFVCRCPTSVAAIVELFMPARNGKSLTSKVLTASGSTTVASTGPCLITATRFGSAALYFGSIYRRQMPRPTALTTAFCAASSASCRRRTTPRTSCGAGRLETSVNRFSFTAAAHPLA